jgi:predicted O-methyltransferase YrrM
MESVELKRLLEEKLDKQLTSRIFLDRMRVIDEDSRKTSAYNDPKYVPFYYWLGTFVQPKTLIELGFRLGLFSATFLRACKTVERFLGFQEKTDQFYSPKLGKANVRDHYKGTMDVYVGMIHDEVFEHKLKETEWDLAIVNEEVGYDKHREYLDALWSKLRLDGLIVMDYVTRHKPAGEAYFDFCKAKNRDPITIDTRYGVGIIRK